MLKLFHFRSCFRTKSSPSQVWNDMARHKKISEPPYQSPVWQRSRDYGEKWLLTGNQPVDLSAIQSNTLSHFISCQLSYQLKKLTDSGSLERLRGSGGQNKTPPRVVARIKSLIKTRWWSGTWSPPSPIVSRLWLTLRAVKSTKRTSSH